MRGPRAQRRSRRFAARELERVSWFDPSWTKDGRLIRWHRVKRDSSLRYVLSAAVYETAVR